ncbi:VOC family protein [Flavobacterium sp. DG1-102-2]|uniref:VOC family protein n=1 Tax=Flavobacterium sp. DG1-102-2 TaxID=3081663 RepID=UPI002949D9B3|nr:VOC family protein [Flavobacterium sp. DG1-102-2]MDV6168875.1 VOC family protein [Flavobacterium sp. DG1-102-2]
MTALNPYLNFNGNTEEVFNFYRSVFGGEFAMLMRFGDTPGCEDMPETEKDGIMHIALPIGNNVIMGTDVPKSMEQVTTGTNLSISVHLSSREEADRVYNGLSTGGKATMPMNDMFWGDYYGMLTDKFDIQWMVSFNPKMQQQ